VKPVSRSGFYGKGFGVGDRRIFKKDRLAEGIPEMDGIRIVLPCPLLLLLKKGTAR
jgi:hypothetical protein